MLWRNCVTSIPVLNLIRIRNKSTRILSQDEFVGNLVEEASRRLSEKDRNALASSLESFFRLGCLGSRLQERLNGISASGTEHVHSPWRAILPSDKSVPNLIYKNWWCLFKDVEISKFMLSRPPPENVFSHSQIARASDIIIALINFKKILDDNMLHLENYDEDSGAILAQYHRLFCNPMTKEPCDGSKICIIANGKVIIFPIKDQSGNYYSHRSIRRGLYEVCNYALNTNSEMHIPLLTASSAELFERFIEVLSKSDVNVQNLNHINTSLFVLCLDSYSPHKRDDIAIHQFATNFDAGNRWFSKPFQIVVGNNGRAGACGNLYLIDTETLSRMINYIVANEPFKVKYDSKDLTEYPKPTKLEWDVSEELDECMKEVLPQIKDYVYPIEACMFEAKDLGTKYINDIANMDVDAYMVLLLALAWYRLREKAPSIGLICHARSKNSSAPSLVRLNPTTFEDFLNIFDNDDVLYENKIEKIRKTAETITKQKEISKNSPDILEHAKALLDVSKVEEKEEANHVLNSEIIEDMRKLDLVIINFDRSFLFKSGVLNRVNNQCTISYIINKYDSTLSISSSKLTENNLCFKLRYEISRSINDLPLLFPRRSEVWKLPKDIIDIIEKKEIAILKKHKSMSDSYMKRQEEIARRYSNFDRSAENYEYL